VNPSLERSFLHKSASGCLIWGSVPIGQPVKRIISIIINNLVNTAIKNEPNLQQIISHYRFIRFGWSSAAAESMSNPYLYWLSVLRTDSRTLIWLSVWAMPNKSTVWHFSSLSSKDRATVRSARLVVVGACWSQSIHCAAAVYNKHWVTPQSFYRQPINDQHC